MSDRAMGTRRSFICARLGDLGHPLYCQLAWERRLRPALVAWMPPSRLLATHLSPPNWGRCGQGCEIDFTVHQHSAVCNLQRSLTARSWFGGGVKRSRCTLLGQVKSHEEEHSHLLDSPVIDRCKANWCREARGRAQAPSREAVSVRLYTNGMEHKPTWYEDAPCICLHIDTANRKWEGHHITSRSSRGRSSVLQLQAQRPRDDR